MLTATDQGVYVLKVTNTIVPDLELVSYDVEHEHITGMDEVRKREFTIYPNPVKGSTMNISVPDSKLVDRLEIVDATGNVVKTQKIENNLNSINISTLSDGIYIVKVIYSDAQIQVQKLIVK